MPLKNDREYRTITAPLECRMESDEPSYIVEGYATTFDAPYLLYDDGEQKIYEEIKRSAMEGADMSDVIMQYNHEGKVFARQSNGTLQIILDEHGMKVRADLSKSQAARDMYEEIRNGLVTKMSWAFTVAEDQYDRKTSTRSITAIRKVYDVSAVSLPANADTEISARSYFDGVIEASKQERLEAEKAKARINILLEVNR